MRQLHESMRARPDTNTRQKINDGDNQRIMFRHLGWHRLDSMKTPCYPSDSLVWAWLRCLHNSLQMDVSKRQWHLPTANMAVIGYD